MVVVYCEKPDMAEKVASSLGGSSFKKSDKPKGYYSIQYKGQEYAVTWGYGHLCALANAEQYDKSYKNWSKMPMPFIPDEFSIVMNTASPMPVKDAVKKVKELFKQADYIINATDYDREGELIFYYLYEYLKCKKRTLRVKLSSTTKNGIIEAFENMVPLDDVENVLESAKCRSIADWVVGCNLTAAMSLKSSSGTVLSIGRVQTPTLDMIVRRDEEIENFKPEKYFTLEGVFTKDNGETYKGTHETKRFTDIKEAENALEKCRGHKGIVTEIKKTEKTKRVPLLYNLDSLQMEANGKYGMSLKRTLDTVQKLYEKGFVSYPRTDSQFLPEDMTGKIKEVQEMLKNNGFSNLFTDKASDANMLKNSKHFFDDSKVGSHYAIVPTEVPASNLTNDEEKIYGLIADSVIRMLYPEAVLEASRVVTSVNDQKFITNGTSIKDPGWMVVHGQTKEELIPHLDENEEVKADIKKLAKETEPPKHYTDKTLLSAMVSAGKNLEDEELKKFMAEQKNSGIGTPATRAGIIEQIIKRGYASRDGKSILSTERGRKLIHVIPVEDVKSVKLTAEYEKRLNEIMNGEASSVGFLDSIYRNVNKWTKEIMNMSDTVNANEREANTNLTCPACGKPLYKHDWGYGCTGYQKDGEGCSFSVGRICGKMLTESQLRNLFKKGEIGPLNGFKKSDGTEFSGTLSLTETDGKYRVWFKQRESHEGEMPDLYASCPECGAKMVKGKWGWECEDKCGVRVPYELCNRKISKLEAEALLNQGTTDILEGFISKKGNPFSAGLKMEGKDVKFFFPER